MATLNKVQALNIFWNSFGLKAYDETAVPDGVELPYITYETIIDSFNYNTMPTGSLWYYSSSLTDVTQKALEIERRLGEGGVAVKYDGGILWIRKGNPFAQRVSDSNDMIKRMLINLQIEYIGD